MAGACNGRTIQRFVGASKKARTILVGDMEDYPYLHPENRIMYGSG